MGVDLITEIASNVKKWRQGEEIFPLQLELELTKRCNLNCWHCWRNYFPYSSQELSDKSILDLISQLVFRGLKRIDIPGAGEPLLRKGLIREIVFRFPQLQYYLTTNGTLLGWVDINDFLFRFEEILISLDNLGKEHDLNRGKGVFKKIDDFLVEIEAFKRANRVKKPMIKFKSILFENSCKEEEKILNLLKYAQKRGVEEIYFMPFQDYQKKEILFPSFTQEFGKKITAFSVRNNLSDFIVSKVKENNLPLKKEEKKENNSYKWCYYPWYNILVSAEGNVGPCCNQSIFPLEGSASLWEIWHHKFDLFRTKKSPCYLNCTEWQREFWRRIDEKLS